MKYRTWVAVLLGILIVIGVGVSDETESKYDDGWVKSSGFIGTGIGGSRRDPPPHIQAGGWIKHPGFYKRFERAESVAEFLNRIGGVPVTTEDLLRHTKGEVMRDVLIRLYKRDEEANRNRKPGEYPLWTSEDYRIGPDDERMWARIIKEHECIQVSHPTNRDRGKFVEVFHFKPQTKPNKSREGKRDDG